MDLWIPFFALVIIGCMLICAGGKEEVAGMRAVQVRDGSDDTNCGEDVYV